MTTKTKRKPSAFAKCVGGEMKGQTYGSRAAVQKAFKDAVKNCKTPKNKK